MNNSKNYKKELIVDLSNKSLRELPHDIHEYTNLITLNLSNNKFTNLPESLAVLKDVTTLDISYNPLTKIPAWVWMLKGLKKLNISGLNIKELPVEIGNLKSLEILIIDGLKLKFLPESIGYLRNLKELSLSANNFEELPTVLSYFKSLKQINVSENKLRDISKITNYFKGIERIDVSNNVIRKVPHSIGVLKQLSYLDISQNKIKSIPASLLKLNLKETQFYFRKNPLSRLPLENIEEMFYKQRRESRKAVVKPRKEESAFSIVLVLFLVLAIPVLFAMVYFKDKKDEELEEKIEKQKQKEIHYTYLSVKDKQQERLEAMLEKTKQVYVYTNDTANLKLTIKENAKFYSIPYFKEFSETKKIKPINDFLNDKSRGYTVDLDNGRRTIKGVLRVFDSVIPKTSFEKYRLIVGYKRPSDNVDKSATDYRVHREVFTFKEEKDGNVVDKSRAALHLSYYNLNRKGDYFYFTSFNANVSKEEFLVAVKQFDKILRVKSSLKRHCRIQTLSVTE